MMNVWYIRVTLLPLLLLAAWGVKDSGGELSVKAAGHGAVEEGVGRFEVYPSEVYPGENILTVTHSDGISEIRPMFDSLTKALTTVELLDDLSTCPDSARMRVHVGTSDRKLSMRFIATSCSKRRQVIMMKNRYWILQEFPFPDVKVGDTVCRSFYIGLRLPEGTIDQYYIDSFTTPAPNIYVDGLGEMPAYLRNDARHSYTVCYVAKAPGMYRFPVTAWIRRFQPVDGLTNYPIADTGVVQVLPNNAEGTPSTGD